MSSSKYDVPLSPRARSGVPVSPRTASPEKGHAATTLNYRYSPRRRSGNQYNSLAKESLSRDVWKPVQSGTSRPKSSVRGGNYVDLKVVSRIGRISENQNDSATSAGVTIANIGSNYSVSGPGMSPCFDEPSQFT